MAQANLRIAIQTKGQRQLERMTKSLKEGKISAEKFASVTDGKLKSAFSRLGTTAQRSGQKIDAAFKKGISAAGKFGKKVSGLRTQLLGLGAGAAFGKAFADASALERAEARIGTLVKNFNQYAGIQEVAAQAAQKFKLSQVESLNALTDLGNRLGDAGVSLADVQNIYEGFNTLLANNKVEAAQAASATLQLNQALGSGRLAGEEFNAINEATPQLLSEVARVMGVTRGELKKLAADGKISSGILIQALTNIRKDGAADLETALSGSFGAVKEFQQALSDFSVTVGKELLPAITPLIQGLTELLKAFGTLPGPVKTAAVAIAAVGTAAVVAAPGIIALIGGIKALAGVGAFAALLNPVTALVAGVAALGFAFYKTGEEKRQLDELIRSGSINELSQKSDELRGKLQAAEARLVALRANGVSPVSRAFQQQKDKVDKLQAALNAIQGTYKVRIEIEELFSGKTDLSKIQSSGYGRGDQGLTYTVGGVTYDARTGKPIVKTPQAITPPAATTGKDKDKKSGTSAADKLQQQLRAGRELSRQFQQQKQLLMETDVLKKALLENDFKRLELERQIKETAAASQQAALLQQASEVSRLERVQLIKDSLEQQTSAARALVSETQLALEADARRKELIESGINPALADSLVAIEQQFEPQKRILDASISTLEVEIDRAKANGAVTTELEEQLKKYKELRGELDKAQEGKEGQAKEANPGAVEALIKRWQSELQDTEAMVASLAQTVQGELSSAMTSAITSVIDGTGTAQEAFANMFKNIGKAFISMATQMIAKALVMKALGILGGGLFGGGGGGGGFGSGYYDPNTGLGTAGPNYGLADGGFITSPTKAMVGEGGANEYVIPENKMGAAMARWNSGARGNAVVDGADPTGKGGGVMEPEQPPQINISGGVMQFDDTNYIRQDQIPAIVSQASKAGESRALRRLQMSPTARGRVGVR